MAARWLTQIDAFDPKESQAFVAGLFAVLVRAVDLIRLAALDEAEFGGEKDVVALASAFEPPSNELLAVTIETNITQKCQ